MEIGSFELSVLRYGDNWIAYAHFLPNPLCSAWIVCDSEQGACDQVETWYEQVATAMHAAQQQERVG